MPDTQNLPLTAITAGAVPTRRFDRVAITSVFGPPGDPRTWSGAPFNLGAALARLGIAVESIHPRMGRAHQLSLGVHHVLEGFGRLSAREQLLRGARARDALSLQVTEATARLGVRHVLHTGTLDLPAFDLLPGIRHYLYCDHTWDLSLRHRIDVGDYSTRALQEFERLEAESVRGVAHVFTFARYVRDNLIRHYGLAPERVTAVGSGMGPLEPYAGPKSYTPPHLLFVAKHLFAAKGGPLTIDAFQIALARRPDLRLTVVADPASRRLVPRHPRIAFHARLPWTELQSLYRSASLLVQPMLNDPWGQVYLEALASRTPVLGLDRNGLPEIIAGGRFGFTVDRPEPRVIADAIVDAVADPERLARMGQRGQAHVLGTFGWDRVAAAIAYASQERKDDVA